MSFLKNSVVILWTFYALIENKELDIVLNLQIQNGNTWVDPDETEGLSNAVRKNLIVFATDVHEMVLIRELDEEESKLKEQNKELEEYRKEIEKSKNKYIPILWTLSVVRKRLKCWRPEWLI